MTQRSVSNRYGRIAQAFHWLSAMLILIMWPLGVVMTRISEDSAAQLYQVHVGLGMVILVLTVLRLVWLFIDKHPEPPVNIEPWRKRAFTWNHRLLYIGLLLLSVSGIAMLLGSGISLPPTSVPPEAITAAGPQQTHSVLSRIFIVLLLMHIGGVVSYHLTKGNTLARMGVPLQSPKG
ncbi:MAG: cytochrome b/b6 domain-containing protein [Chloroflexota bacterium]